MPPDIHATLKARAAASGRSLSDYALEILAREASTPTLDEMIERVRLRGPVDATSQALEILRADRDAS